MGDPSSFSLDTEQIEPVPFTHLNDSSEVTDFDLSSQIPEESIGSEDETESLLSHYPRRRRKSESRSRSTWGGRTDRRRSFMTNMTDMSMMTSFGRGFSFFLFFILFLFLISSCSLDVQLWRHGPIRIARLELFGEGI